MKVKYFKRTVVAVTTSIMVLLALFAFGVLWPADRLEPVRTTYPLAIVHVTVVDVQANRLVPGQTVFVIR